MLYCASKAHMGGLYLNGFMIHKGKGNKQTVTREPSWIITIWIGAQKQMVNLNYMHRSHFILQSSKLKWAVHWLIFWWPFYVLLVHKLLTRNKHFMKRQKTKNWRECLEINSMFQTSVGCFFSVLSHLSHELKTWFKLSRVKFYRSYLKGD